MCFFKAKMPKAVNPQVMAAIPDDAKAPEPQAPVFGGTEQNLADSGETVGKTGISSIKVAKDKVTMPTVTVTGANTSLGGYGLT